MTTEREVADTELSISVLFYNLLGLFLLVAVGFAAVRANVIPARASGIFSALLMKVTLPFTIFTSMIRPFDPDFLKDSLIVILLAFALFLLFAIFGMAGAKLLRVPVGRRGTWAYCAMFSNSGSMGFPVAYALLGDEGLALAVMMNIPVNILIYTVGIKLMSTDRTEGTSARAIPWRGILLSPVNLGMALGLLFYCTQIPVPEALMMPMEQLSNVTAPLAMMTIGMTLSEGKWRDMVGDRDVLTGSATRLLVFPLITWAALMLLPISNPMVRAVFLIIMAMPAPAVSSIVAEEYGGSRELAARTVFLTSLLCVGTIPLMVMLL